MLADLVSADTLFGGHFQEIHAFGEVADVEGADIAVLSSHTLALEVVYFNHLDVRFGVDVDVVSRGVREDKGVFHRHVVDVHGSDINHSIDFGGEAGTGDVEDLVIDGQGHAIDARQRTRIYSDRGSDRWRS